MLVLVVDTAGAEGGVALARCDHASPSEADVLGERRLEPRKFSTQLISAIAELLAANRLGLSDLDAFAVVSGPGSFTGLRVGLSAVKAMAEVGARPVIAVSRLAMMASAAASVKDLSGKSIHAVLDAGRGEFYHGVYGDGGRTCILESLETAASLTASLDSIPGLVVASEPEVVAALRAMSDGLLQPIPLVGARAALPLVLAAWRARNFSDVATLDANYVRRIDPKPGEDGAGSKAAHVPQRADARTRA